MFVLNLQRVCDNKVSANITLHIFFFSNLESCGIRVSPELRLQLSVVYLLFISLFKDIYSNLLFKRSFAEDVKAAIRKREKYIIHTDLLSHCAFLYKF